MSTNPTTRRAAGVGALLALAACGGGGGNAPAEPLSGEVGRLDIARAVYAVSPSVPAAFYTEPDPYPDRTTLRYHVLASEISAATGADWEACADDFASASEHAAASAAARGYPGAATGSSETAWFFQFDRTIDAAEPAMLIVRLFKCSAFDRSLRADGVAGQLMSLPATAADLRFVAEYLWSIGPFNNALNAVVDSRAGAGGPRHRLRRAAAERLAGSNGCDIVEVWDLVYSADNASGLVSVEETFVDVFEARYEAGVVSLCSG